MRIQLALGEQDTRYMNTLLAFLERNYMEQVEVRAFSTPELLKEFLKSNTVDIVLLDEEFGMTPDEVPGEARTAWLVNDNERTEIDGVRTVSKFRKPELLYKDILALYAERGKGGGGYAKSNTNCQLILFQGFSGGTGASTMSAAASRYLASCGEKVLYLNLETTGNSASFFKGEGNYNFEDVIYALKSKRVDLGLKLESTVRRDASGVYYFAPCKMAISMLEMTDDDIMQILSTLKNVSDYTKVIIDMEFALTDRYIQVMDYADQIVIVNDGTDIANSKVIRTMKTLEIIEEQKQVRILDHIAMIYNKFSSSKSSNTLPPALLPVLGTFPPVKHALVNEIIQIILTKQGLFEKLR
ncbi:AAA family ATPase [Lachnospiraceae bacterium 62-35]